MRLEYLVRSVLIVTAAALVGGIATFAQGQSPTDFLNNEWKRQRGMSEDNRSRSRESGWDRWNDRDSDDTPHPRRRAPRKKTVASEPGGGAYCVRTCDGFYFPLASHAGNGDSQALCQSLCPAAKTDVYYRRGDSMDEARTRSGMSYASLPEAFNYRKQLKRDCSCRSAGTPSMSVANDPTLRSGDLVVTQAGVVVFRGGSQLPHQDRDFVDYRRAKEVAGQHRHQLDALINRYYTVRAQAPAEARQAHEPTHRARRRRR
jgi:hypothetical protein